MASFAPGALLGRWVHSREEDTADGIVYRPASYSFPAARGREGFDLRDDGTLLAARPGPVDRTIEAAGTWTLEGDGLLALSSTGPGFPAKRLRVVSVDGERLVVKPEGD